MLALKLGIGSLKRALRSYFSEFENRNADTADLCRCCSTELGIDLGTYFEAWTEQSNFPVVIVEEDGTVHQERFTSQGIFNDRTWPLPLSIVIGVGDSVREEVIELGAEPFKLPADCDWVKINHDSQSFCVVWPKGRYFTGLQKAIRGKLIGPIDRWHIISDCRLIARSGLISHADLIRLLNSYIDEDDPFVCLEILNSIGSLCSLFPNAKILARSVLPPMLSKIGIVGSPQDEDRLWLLRGRLIESLAVLVGDTTAIEFGKAQLEAFKADRKSIDPNLIQPVLRIANLFGDAYNFIWELIETESDPQISSLATSSIGFCSEEKYEETLEKAITGLRQNVQHIATGICANPRSGRTFWEFFQSHSEAFLTAFQSLPFTLPALVELGLGQLYDEAEIPIIEKFFQEHPMEVAARALQKGIDGIRVRARIISKDLSAVEQALSEIATT